MMTRSSSMLLEARGTLVASIDLTQASTWQSLVDVTRVPPGKLTCTSSDPQVLLALPAALSRRLAGTLMEVEVESPGAGTLQVFWDLGSGFSKDYSERCHLQDQPPGRQAWYVPFPPGVISLRLDPLDQPGRIDILAVRFYEPEPRGAEHFPFGSFSAPGPPHSWLTLPEVQQAVSRRVLGTGQRDWTSWLFTSLLREPIERCLHLGAEDLTFGTEAVEMGYVHDYVAVPRHTNDLAHIVSSPISTSAARWLPSVDAIPPGSFDLILSTGYFSSNKPGLPAVSALSERTGGTLVLVERFQTIDEERERLLARYLELTAAALPPGWSPTRVEASLQPVCRLDGQFFARFECFEVRPFGGTLLEPLFYRLPSAFFGLGAFTMLGAIAGTHLLLEETLIATGLLPSLFNLVVALPLDGRRLQLSHLPTGWSVDPGTSFGALIGQTGIVPPRLEPDRFADALGRAIELIDDTSSASRTTGVYSGRLRGVLRRGLRRLANAI